MTSPATVLLHDEAMDIGDQRAAASNGLGWNGKPGMDPGAGKPVRPALGRKHPFIDRVPGGRAGTIRDQAASLRCAALSSLAAARAYARPPMKSPAKAGLDH